MRYDRTRRSMTVHRRSAYGARSSMADRDQPMTLLETITAFTALQIGLCVVILAGIFTLQFLDGEQYDLMGRYYRTVMGRAGEDAVEVGIFGDAVDWDGIARQMEKTMMGQLVREEDPTGEELGMGGENPYIPQNLYEGKVIVSAPARFPVYGTVTSPFGLRVHPITGNGDFHTGVDIAAPEGADIYAAYPGTVTEASSSDIYGNFVTLDHGGGLTTTYCHCRAILAKVGERLRAGARIAEVGSTGMATGPHLHLTVRVNGDLVDPMNLFLL